MHHYVYEIINNINHKKYIGKRSCECNIENDKYMGSGVIIRKAIKKYGLDNFTKQTIKTFSTEEEAFKYEKQLIEKLNAVNDSNYYNIKDGGLGNSRNDAIKLNKNLSSEKRIIRSKKLSILNSGKNNAMYGKTGKNNPTSKEIVMLSLDGDLIKIFNCIREANDYFNNPKTYSLISKVCKNKYGTAYKYLWLFKSDYNELINNNTFNDWVNNTKNDLKENRKIALINTQQSLKKPVYMLNQDTYEIMRRFESATDAGLSMNIVITNITRNCKHKSITAGGYSWIYVEEYNKLTLSQIVRLYKHSGKSVVCINTGEVFDMIKKASIYYNLKSSSGIIECCKKERDFSGKHHKTNEPIIWMYYNEYINKSMEEIQQLIIKVKNNDIYYKQIICTTTNEIFKTSKEASNKYNISNIHSCCRGERKSAGKHPITKEPLKWMYYDEYIHKMEVIGQPDNFINTY